MKKFMLVFVLFLAFHALKASDCTVFFPQDIGTVLVYNNYDDDGDLESIIHYKVVDKKTEAEGLKITVETKSFKDDDDDEPMVTNLDFYCKDGVFYWNMQSSLNAESMKSFKESGAEMKIDANDLAFPSDIHVGQKLPDGNISMKMKTMFMTMEMNVKIYNRSVDAKESIKVKAGTFDCYKISQESQSKVMISEIKIKTISWFAENIGIVKTQTYDDDGDLKSTMELVEIRKK